MPSLEIKPDGTSGTGALALLVTVWLLALITGCLVFHAYEHAANYEIPPFLIDVFVRVCEFAAGGTAIGAGIGLAVHETNKRIETAKKEAPKIEMKD